MSHVAIGKGIHVLDEDTLLREVLEHNGQRTAHVRTYETDDVGDLHCEVMLLKNLIGLLWIRDDTTENTEVTVIRNTHG